MGRMCFKTYQEMQEVPLEELTEWEIPDDPKWGRQYQSSWDKLMPVIQKIDLLNQQDPISLENYDVAYQPLSTPINKVYEDVIEFIKWYNQLKEV